MSSPTRLGDLLGNAVRFGVLPIGVMVSPGAGIQDKFADQARKLGIPVWKFGGA